MKRFTILISLLFVLFSCGCGNSFTSPKEVTFAFIEESSMVKQTASVVSILSSGRVYTGSDSYSTTRVLSGVILNEEGYILTSSEACNFDVSDNGTIYEGKFTNAYAVLSDVYQDQRHYMLNFVDNREEAGLALFRLQTDFYYENQAGERKSGFQYPAVLSSREPQTGIQCYAVGNSLAEILANNTFFHTSFNDLHLSVTKGIVSMKSIPSEILDPYSLDSKTCNPSVISAAVNREMCGGGVFDENGYLLGIVASKLVSETANGISYLTKMSIMLESSWIADYLNFVSERNKIEIPYTIATMQEESVQ